MQMMLIREEIVARIDAGGNILHADGLYHRHHFQCGQRDFCHRAEHIPPETPPYLTIPVGL